ncbi:glutathione S-transferase family protein [Neptunomonas antarctica]|uniref:Tetrachloro-p-hydroquinone reductive dehalogenase n=1 Tax=Neptunomonas antarctica TaxID=619304 RepID=A0A1N7M9Z1_9GAMM|nr:glutathione S-transferase family protein [Neptunomonas antarctica]SIS82914.1 tetrachloro-p-hydroquinone reductive dehalogenase [Neptunomonas antarctica]
MYSLTLHHHPLSVCSMKVRLALEEKGLDWSSNVIDIVREQEQLEPWYVKLNSNGVIPTLEFHNGETEVVTNSASIIRFIASLPESNSLLPTNNRDLQLMNKLIDLADEVDLQILSYARHPSMEKSEKILDARIDKSLSLAEQHPELKSNYLACAARSEKSKTFRVDAKHIKDIEQSAEESLSVAEKQLNGNAFLLGDIYSLADVIWTVVLSRLDLLGYTDWINGHNFPLLGSYYQRAQDRKSFTLAQIQNEWWDK